MSGRWVKLHASGECEGLYLVKESLPVEGYLYERQLRELLEFPEAIADRWPVTEVFAAYADSKHRRLDFAAPLFVFKSAVSEHAMDRLRERLDGYVEWLPLKVQDGREFFIPHPLVTVDALDKEKSEISYVDGYPKEPKYITAVHQEWMHEVAELDGLPIFRTPETAGREPYISTQLAEFIQSEGITGAAFSPVGTSGDR